MKQLIFTLFICMGAQVFSQVKPNFIFITIDDNNDWIQGFSGHPQVETPNIQFLEKKGTTFLNAYCSAPQCGPSRTSFLTGKDCDYTKIYHNSDLPCLDFRSNFNEAENNETVFTIPEILKDSAGYYTYSISKVFHCHDANADYDSLNPDICGRLYSWNKAIYFDYINAEQNVILDYGDSHQMGVFAWPYSVIPDSMEYLMQDYLAADSAIAFLDDYAAHPENYCGGPFFLGLGFRRPHAPYYIPEHYYSDFYNDDYYSVPYDLPYNNPVGSYPYNGIVMPPQPVPMWNDYDSLPVGGVARALIDENKVHLGVLDWANSQEAMYGIPFIQPGMTDDDKTFALEEAKRANLVMSYLAAIKFADAQLGRVINELKTHPELYNNTIIIVLGDHGYSLGEKTHWKKGCLWETDIRAPLVIADLRNPAKKTCKRFVSFLDLFPTICDMAGVAYPTFPDGSDYLDGFSLVPLMSNPAIPWSRPVLQSFRNTRDLSRQGSCFPSYSVRDEEWHYIRYYTNGDAFPGGCDEATSEMQEELYHIGKKKNIDPYEWNNLAGDPAYAAEKEYLATYLPGGVNYLQFARETDPLTAESLSLELSMFPNPASTLAELIVGGQPGEAEIQVYNATGQLVFVDDVLVDDNFSGSYYLNLKNWPAGYYIAKVTQNNETNSLNFVVQH